MLSQLWMLFRVENMISIEQTGMEDIIGRLKKFSMPKTVNKAMNNARERAEIYAMGYAPKDTGELAESIYSYDTDGGFILGASAKHAVFNEYGSITTPVGSVMSPLPAKKVGIRPFLRPALLHVREEIPKLFKKYSEEIVTHG